MPASLLDAQCIEIDTTVEAIVDSFTFGPDCRIDAILPSATPSLVREVGTLSCRLMAINDTSASDSGELKTVLLRAAAAVGPNGKIKATFARADTHAARIAIEESVTYDGAKSELMRHDSHAIKEMMESVSRILEDAVTAGGLAAAAGNEQTKGTQRATLSAASGGFRRANSNAGHSEHGGEDETFVALTPTLANPGPSANFPSTHVTSRSFSAATESEASTTEFDTIRLNQMTTMSASAFTTAEPPAPDLLEFDKMRLSIRGEDSRTLPLPPRSPAEVSIKSRLQRALDKVTLGNPVICVVQDVNPIAEIELLALSQQKRVVGFDLGVKLRLRPKADVFAQQFAEAMRTGAWFVVLNAHKSINMCSLFDELLADAKQRNLEGFDPRSKIIVTLEQHPHFPKRLIKDAVLVKMISAFQGSSILSESMATSQSRNRLVRADALSISHRSAGDEAALLGSGTSTTPAVSQKPAKRRVRITAAVDIVDIAPREVVKSKRRDQPIDVSGSVALVKTFCGVPNDTFLCLNIAGESGRFAVGSGCGNVYFLDSEGNSLLQTHTHDGAIWDVAFNDKYSFATGCEDGTSATWTVTSEVAEDDDGTGASLVPTSATALGADVYAVGYLKNTTQSPLLIGGLHNNLVIRPPNSNVVEFVPLPSNTQVIDCLPGSSTALVGGGDGSVCVIDVDQLKSVAVVTEHNRKIPALTVRDNNHFFTGSFDCCILSWDLRVRDGVTGSVKAHTAHTLQLRNFVTGLHIDDVHLAASVGENLYLWDVRKLDSVLGGYPQAWKGLSRGIKVQSMDHLVVTASPDGFTRFWNFV